MADEGLEILKVTLEVVGWRQELLVVEGLVFEWAQFKLAAAFL